MGPGTGTAWQHDARWQPDRTLTMFDNGVVAARGTPSRASIHERIDWTHPHRLADRPLRAHPAAADRQPGQRPGAEQTAARSWAGANSRTSANSTPPVRSCSTRTSRLQQSYRAYTFPWTGARPVRRSLAVSPSSGEANTVYASWNGATGVSAWRVLAGPNPAQLSTIATAQREGFQTAIPVHNSQSDFEVQAIGPSGQTLSTSAPVQR